jgi:2'-hydroxyisoflavone reductase
MKILILGGTGFLGRHIVDAAIQRSHTLTLFNRGQSAAGLFPGIETIIGDREHSHEALSNRTWDAVIDTNARMPKVARIAARLLKSATSHYTFISSITAYADSQPTTELQTDSNPLDEDATLAHLDEQDIDNKELRTYGGRKALCEQWIREEIGDSLLVIRPGLIVGPYDSTDRFTYWPMRIAEGGEVLAPGDGSDRVRFIDVRDLAEWTIKMVERGLTGAYNALGPDRPITIKDLLEACRQVCNPRASLSWADTNFLAANEVRAWWDMPVWAPGLRPMSAKKAIDSGLTFRPLEKTIRDTAAWSSEANMSRPLKAGLDVVRENSLLTRLREKLK